MLINANNLKHLQKSFKEALNEVYELNKFPLREHVMKCALESDGFLMEMEVFPRLPDIAAFQTNAIFSFLFLFYAYPFRLFLFQFHNCTKGITEEVSVCLTVKMGSTDMLYDLMFDEAFVPAFRLQRIKLRT